MRSVTRWRDKLSCLLGLTKSKKSTSSANVYSETAYRDLVQRESKRSERSGHLCRILLVYRTNAQGLVMPMGSEHADKMSSVLSMGIRDTDYIGWYRENRILGVLLTALRPDSAREGCDNLKIRVEAGLRGIPSADDHSLQLCVLEQGELTTFNAADHPVPFSASKD